MKVQSWSRLSVYGFNSNGLIFTSSFFFGSSAHLCFSAWVSLVVFEEVFSERGALLMHCRPIRVSKAALIGFVCVVCSIHSGLEQNSSEACFESSARRWLAERDGGIVVMCEQYNYYLPHETSQMCMHSYLNIHPCSQ